MHWGILKNEGGKCYFFVIRLFSHIIKEQKTNQKSENTIKNVVKIISNLPKTKFSISLLIQRLSSIFAQQGRTFNLEGRTFNLEGRTLLITFFSKVEFILVLNKIGANLRFFDSKKMVIIAQLCQKSLFF